MSYFTLSGTLILNGFTLVSIGLAFPSPHHSSFSSGTGIGLFHIIAIHRAVRAPPIINNLNIKPILFDPKASAVSRFKSEIHPPLINRLDCKDFKPRYKVDSKIIFKK